MKKNVMDALESSGFSITRDYPIEAVNGPLRFWCRATATDVLEVRMSRLDDLGEVVESYAEVYDPAVDDCVVYEHSSVDGKTELDLLAGHLKALAGQREVF